MRVALIQARTGSTRFPNKVLAPIGGVPMLGRVVERARRISGLDLIAIVTSDAPGDDAIAELARELAVPVFRGSESDVLDRYFRAAKHLNAQVIMRITADCPLLDPDVSAEVLRAFEAEGADYASNINPPTFPDGLDTEVLTRDALATAWSEARLGSDREHVTLYIRRHASGFRTVNVANPRDFAGMRWTVDEPADLEFVDQIFGSLGNAPFGWLDVLRLLEVRPELIGLNGHIERDLGLKRSLAKEVRYELA